MKQILRYGMWGVVGFRLLITLHLVYRYLVFVSQDSTAKAGTLVEAVATQHPVSYIPYTSFSPRARLYQQLLFESCLDYDIQGTILTFSERLCQVTSSDQRVFTVTLAQQKQRSDSTPITLDDIYSTYHNIITQNQRSIDELRVFSDVVVEQGDTAITVTFPTSTLDNERFFTYFILPQKFITETSFTDYQAQYTQQPLRGGCASLLPQGADDNSLLFDVKKCPNVKFLLYQLKLFADNVLSPEQEELFDIVDASLVRPSDQFVQMSFPSRSYSVLFFNTQSTKLRAKLQRALGGLIFHQFYDDTDVTDVLRKDHLLFDAFLSTGDNIGNYLAVNTPGTQLDTFDLQKIDIEQIPTEVDLTTNTKPVHYLEKFQGYRTTKFLVDQAYDRVTIQHNDNAPYAPRTYDPVSQSFYYSLSIHNKNIAEGLNQYIIVGTKDGVKNTIATLDLYYVAAAIDQKQEFQVPLEQQLVVLSFADPVSDFILARLRSLLNEHDIIQYFRFVRFDDVDQFDGKLAGGDYDMAIRTVDLGLRTDVSSLLGSSIPSINPSLYTDEAFVSALSQYYANGQSADLYDRVMSTYMQDVPFVILGNIFDQVSVRAPLTSFLSGGVVGLYDFKKDFINKVKLGSQLQLQRSEVFAMDHFQDFLQEMFSSSDIGS